MIKISPVTLSIHDHLAHLMYAFKFKNREQYFKSLEWLRNVMDDSLYQFFYGLGKETYWR